MTGRANKFAADDVIFADEGGALAAVSLREFDESKVKRDDGEFAEKEGKAADTSKSLSKLRTAMKVVGKIINAGPAIAGKIVKESGASPAVTRAAMILATAGDWAVPGVPAGSIVIGALGTAVLGVKKVAALKLPRARVREALDIVKKEKGKTDAE